MSSQGACIPWEEEEPQNFLSSPLPDVDGGWSVDFLIGSVIEMHVLLCLFVVVIVPQGSFSFAVLLLILARQTTKLKKAAKDR